MFYNNSKKFALSISGLFLMTLVWTSCRKDVVSAIQTPSTVTTKDTLVPNISITLANDTLVAGDTLDNGNLLLGNPTDAKHLLESSTNYLFSTTFYVTSYDSKKGIPNWVSWHLTKSDIGTISRTDAFANYTLLPTSWYQVMSSSYQGSITGFDRGHNCPSGDRTSTTEANTATFYMTNMIPQSPTLNQGPWEGLESKLRDSLVVSQSKEIYIVMGNYGVGGTGSKGGITTTIDNGNVTVPNHVWKVAIILDNGNGDLNRITSSTTVLAVDMPNNQALYTTSNKTAWRNYITTINDIEAASKAAGSPINILSRLSATIQTALKAKKYAD